jgi:tetratricopeptide (TPR) repeat protein
VRALRSQLGVDPLDETVRLTEEVLAGQVVLRTDAGSRAGVPPPSTADRARHSPTPSAGRGAAPRWRPPLVARERELAMLSTVIERAHTDGVVVIIEGEAGSGRTRLLDELLRRPNAGGRRMLSTVCRPDETRRPYGTVIELLRAAIGPVPSASGWLAELRSDVVREVGRVLPEVAEVAGPPLPVDGQGATSRLTAALATALAAAASAGPQPPGVLVIDDVQWSDASSLDVLSRLARELAGQPVSVLLAWPTELVGRGHPLRRLVTDLAGRQLVRQLPLGRLNAAAVRTLLDDVLGAGRPDARVLTDQIIDLTEGIPLFVVECLVALDRDPAVLAEAHHGSDDLLLGRLDAIGPAALQVLTAAAVLGRPFDVELIRDASGRTGDETVEALAELTAAGLLTAPGHGRAGYDIAHTRLRTLVAERAGHVRRRLLHRRVAAALEHRDRHGAQQLPAVVAAHHAAGGDEPAAAAWFARAAAQAAQLLAVPEAVDHYERALALGHQDPGGIHEALGDLQMLTGRGREALRSYDAAAALVDDERLAVLEHKIAGVYQRWGRWTLADEHLCMALATLEGDEAPMGALRARILTDRGLVALRRNHTEEARSLARAALEEAQRANDPRAQAGAHNLLGVVRKDDLPAARDHLERALDLARRHHDVGVEVAAANNLAQAHAAAGALDRALPLAESALARVGQLADHHREAALRNNLADLLRAAGRHEEAMLHLKRAVALFAEIGEPDERAPEIWPLAVW